MYCHDLEVMSSNPSRVDLKVPKSPIVLEPKMCIITRDDHHLPSEQQITDYCGLGMQNNLSHCYASELLYRNGVSVEVIHCLHK